MPNTKEETTLILLKPDCVRKNLSGTILKRLLSEGFRLRGIKMIQLDEPILREHYAHILDLVVNGEPLFPKLLDFMTSSPGHRHCAERAGRHRPRAGTAGAHQFPEGRQGHYPRRLRNGQHDERVSCFRQLRVSGNRIEEVFQGRGTVRQPQLKNFIIRLFGAASAFAGAALFYKGSALAEMPAVFLAPCGDRPGTGQGGYFSQGVVRYRNAFFRR